MITKASDCYINQYIKCLFDNDLSVLGEGTPEELSAAFHSIETDYIDLSGQYETGDYETIRSIMSLTSRIEHVKVLLYLEYTSLKEFGFPWLPASNDFKKYGHTLTWENDIESFQGQLENIESSEKLYEVKLEIEKKKIVKPENSEQKPQMKRSDFIKMIIGLQKQNYKIDRDKTTLEELAIIVSEVRELIIANEMSHA